MPITNLFRNPNLTTEENRNVNLAELAGGVAGTGLGVLATVPLDARYQNQLLKKTTESQIENQKAKEIWKTLLQLENREITLNDLPPEDRNFYTEKWKENSKNLRTLSNNPAFAKEELAKFDNKVIPFAGEIPKAKMTSPFMIDRRFNPEGRITLGNKVRSPNGLLLPGVLGLAGIIAASSAATDYYESKKEDPE